MCPMTNDPAFKRKTQADSQQTLARATAARESQRCARWMSKRPATLPASIAGEGWRSTIRLCLAASLRTLFSSRSQRFSGAPGHVHLRHKCPGAVVSDLEMDVRRAARIGHGPDRAKPIASVRARDETSVALEVPVAVDRTAICGMEIAAVPVTLPDLDRRTGGGRSIDQRDAPGHVANLTQCDRSMAPDQDQVIVRVKRQAVRIKRPERLARRWRRRKRRRSRRSECRGARSQKCSSRYRSHRPGPSSGVTSRNLVAPPRRTTPMTSPNGQMRASAIRVGQSVSPGPASGCGDGRTGDSAPWRARQGTAP